MHRELGDGRDALLPVEVQVKLVSKSHKGFSQLRSSLHDPLKSFSVDGKSRTRGWDVEADFLLKRDELQYRVTIHVPPDVLRPQLLPVAWEENRDLTFANPRFVLCSHDEFSLLGDVGYRAGTNFAIDVRFGPHLLAGMAFPFSLTLLGQFLPRDDGHPDVELASYPFTLAFPDSRVENVALRMSSEPRESEGRDYYADLRGLLKVGGLSLPVWTDLPEDEGVLCWESRLDEPLTLAVADLDPLMGGSFWRTRDVGQLKPLVDLAEGHTRLVEAGLGVDLLDGMRTDAHAIFSRPDFTFRDGLLTFRDVRMEWEWSHQLEEGQFLIHATLTFCGLTFNALMRPTDRIVHASLAGQDISLDQAMQADAEGHEPDDDGTPTLPPLWPMVRVAEALRERLRLESEDVRIRLTEYDELHLYYCWQTDLLLLRATAVLEDGEDTLVEARWSVPR
jgi:hypothetical protein